MKLFRSKHDLDFDRVISQLRDEQPNAQLLSASAERVWQKIQAAAGSEEPAAALHSIRGCEDMRALLPAYHQHELAAARALIVEDHLRECVACRSYAHGRGVASAAGASWQVERAPRGLQWSFARVSIAAASLALALAIVWAGRSWYVAGPPGGRGQIASLSGQVYRIGPYGERPLNLGDSLANGEFIRTAANSRAKVRLYDGSEVEMNQRVEMAVSATRRDTTIHLDQGSIIVQAAKRRTGHLYVSAPDCTVSVTGTVFSVNSGTKGSRVAVIEGEVRVKHSGRLSILHPGDEVATTSSVGLVPVREEISWSSDLDHQLALLSELSKLREKLSDIPTPGPRYESKILPLLPADTILYIGIPNLGDALQQANLIFQQQLSQSQVLRDWWNRSGNAGQHPTPSELIDQIQAVSQYLGDEVVITCRGSGYSTESGPVLLARIRQAGLEDFLRTHLAAAFSNAQAGSAVHIVNPQTLSSLPADQRGMIMLVRPDMLVAGGNAATVREMNAQLDAASNAFSSTDFGQRITNIYTQGAETVVAVNLGRILQSPRSLPSDTNALSKSGFGDIKYLFATRAGDSNSPDNRITLEFSGPRRGVASWLAAPSPMGSLDYVSSNAGAAISFVAKQPALMLDDVLNIFGSSDPNFSEGWAKANAELGLDIRNDLAASLGGEVTVALDGPVLPTPSWKAILEVNNSGGLQFAIEKLLQNYNRAAQNSNEPALSLSQSQQGGRTFYSIRSQGPGLANSFDYTFADGYLIAAPSRALLIEALQTHDNGTSLARSASFHSLLPSDDHANFSAMLYQNLGPILQPLASHLTSSQLALFQQLAADAKPSVFCAYGESDSIEVASNGKLFGLSPSAFTFFHLLGASGHGTSRSMNP